jgi:hypothetical protein
MYPQRELAGLAARKAELRKNIALRRIQCAVDLTQVAKPLEWLDRAVALWRRIPPLAKLAALPVGLYVIKHMESPRTKLLASLLRWGPLAYEAVKGMR